MEYFKNSRGGEIFYHSSRNGIQGKISPKRNDKNQNRDFGDGFYLGEKKNQTVVLVNSCPHATLYEIQIPKEILNEANTLELTKEDLMYFVLYNRGKLEAIKDTDFYEYYAHLADGKDFIIGTIADDVFASCMKDFTNGVITDYMFLQLIDCYSYGQQIVAKSQKACDMLEIFSVFQITPEEKQEALNSMGFTRREQELDYIKRRAELLIERKGKYISELFNDIRECRITTPQY